MPILDLLIMLANNSSEMPQQNDQDLVSWIIWGVGVVVTSLAGAVAALWKLNESKNAKRIIQLEQMITEKTQRYDQRWRESEARYEQCMQQRDELGRECAGLKTRCELMERHIEMLEERLNRNSSD